MLLLAHNFFKKLLKTILDFIIIVQDLLTSYMFLFCKIIDDKVVLRYY